MEEYIELEIKIVYFDSEDVITDSTCSGNTQWDNNP